MRKRTDAHIHLMDEPILGRNIAEPLKTYKEYFGSDSIGTAFVVFSNAGALEELKELCPDTSIHGFYWIHNLKDYEIPAIAEGIKFESYIDGIDISDIEPVLDSDPLKRPVYIHCGELKSGLSNPAKVKNLAENYPDRKFIIGHAGAYAPPIGERYFKGLNISELVASAVHVAETCNNVFLETSVLYNKQKRDILTRPLAAIKDKETLGAAKRDKNHLINKMLPGTDFPLTIGDVIGNIPADKAIKSEQPAIASQENIIIGALSMHMERNLAGEIMDHLYQNIRRVLS